MSNKDYLNAMLEFYKLIFTIFIGLLFVIYGMLLQNILSLPEQDKIYLRCLNIFLISGSVISLIMYFYRAYQIKKEI